MVQYHTERPDYVRTQRAEYPLITVDAANRCGLTTVKEQTEAKTDFRNWPKIRTLLNEFYGYHLQDHEVILFHISGVWYFMADIGLRMLTPRELYLANGFPPDHIIERDYTGRSRPIRLSREAVRESLQYCFSGLYQNPKWVDFIPYNQRYHPEILEKARLVRIASECCQVPEYVIEEQIMHSCGGKVACPVCGRFSNYIPLT